MTNDMATELRAKKKSISIMSLWPGVVRTEKALSQAELFEDMFSLDYANYCKFSSHLQ